MEGEKDVKELNLPFLWPREKSFRTLTVLKSSHQTAKLTTDKRWHRDYQLFPAVQAHTVWWKIIHTRKHGQLVLQRNKLPGEEARRPHWCCFLGVSADVCFSPRFCSQPHRFPPILPLPVNKQQTTSHNFVFFSFFFALWQLVVQGHVPLSMWWRE